VERFDAELAEVLRREFPAEPLAVTHRVWMVIATKSAEATTARNR